MAHTIISNTPGAREESGVTGLLIAFVVIIAVALGAFVMYQNGFFYSGADTDSTTNINVTVPDPALPAVTTE